MRCFVECWRQCLWQCSGRTGRLVITGHLWFGTARLGAVGELDPKDTDPLNQVFTGFPTGNLNELLVKTRLMDSLVPIARNS
jgi:hypothetical protein